MKNKEYVLITSNPLPLLPARVLECIRKVEIVRKQFETSIDRFVSILKECTLNTNIPHIRLYFTHVIRLSIRPTVYFQFRRDCVVYIYWGKLRKHYSINLHTHILLI